MTLQLHKPDGQGGLEKRAAQDVDWRRQLRSPRWGSQIGRRKRMPGLANTEMNPTSSARSVVFWLALAGLTFVLLIAGYGTGFWK
jgi:hypothetical protein